ncbi:MAG TPA: CHAP domain-containing protein [Pyrinomonadaceae bacterium]|jgi:surface antigen
MKRIISLTFAPALVFASVMFVLQMGFVLPVTAQVVKHDLNTVIEETSKQSSEILPRPLKMKNLRQFAEKNFAGKFDENSLSETISNGKPAITFSFTNGEKITDSILIDNGDNLELNSDTYPVKWKVTPNDSSAESKEETNNFVENLAATTIVPTCAGLSSPGNPYPCCTVNNRGGYGNCTFAAWYHANRFWGVTLPGWSNAGTWFDSAKNARYPTSLTPALYAIAVSSTLSSKGHVAWVMEISNNMILVYEQSCGSTAYGVQQKWYSTTSFNKGYILSPVSAPSPTISLATSGTIYASSNTQAIKFNVSNVIQGARAVVIFPSGGRATLKDSQLSLSNGVLTAYMTLNARGWWSIQVFNENGKYSGVYQFYVN